MKTATIVKQDGMLGVCKIKNGHRAAMSSVQFALYFS